MIVTVRFVGSLRSASGREKLAIEIREGVSLREFVNKIVGKKRRLKRALIDPELEDPRPNALILVNGREISVLNGLETRLRNGDEVVFVPVTHGG
jgi:molybdopterin synthase sulfur carrier subunit